MTLAQLAIALAVVFAVNLLPAFGPPTWAVLVFFSLDFDLPAAPFVLGGALAAARGGCDRDSRPPGARASTAPRRRSSPTAAAPPLASVSSPSRRCHRASSSSAPAASSPTRSTSASPPSPRRTWATWPSTPSPHP